MVRRFLLFVLIFLALAACTLPYPRTPVPESSPTAEIEPGPSGTSTFPLPAISPTLDATVPLVTRTIERIPTENATSTPDQAQNIPATPPATVQPSPSPLFEAFIPAFLVQEETPVYTTNFVDLEAGCDFTGITGQVFDEDGEPLLNLVVKAWGELDGSPVSGVDLTGLSTEAGPGGYIIQLADWATDSRQTIQVQLLDFNANPLSLPISVDTYSACDQNLVILNFVDAPGPSYLPIVPNP